MKTAIINATIEVQKKDLSAQEIARIKKDLSISKTNFRGEKTLELWTETKHAIQLPRAYGYAKLKSLGFSFDDRRTNGFSFVQWVDWDILDKPPYPSDQSAFVQKIVNDTKVNSLGGFGVAPTGSGKTLMGTYIAALLGGSTLIVVHKTDLIENWVKSISSLSKNGQPPGIGALYGDKELWSRVLPFTIATVQSLTRKKYAPEMYGLFRTVIFDECHHVPADTFYAVLKQFPARYVIGLTATLRRKDGTEDVFKHAIGKVLYRMKREGTDGKVFFRRVPFIIAGSRIMASGIPSPSKIGRAFESLEYRNAKILKEIKSAYTSGRKTLVMAHTKEHLHVLMQSLPKIMQKRAAFYYGTLPKVQLMRAVERQILFATYGKASEGTDIPDLDMLLLATPVKDAEQPVGRVLRKYADKMKPIVVDFVDDHKTLKRWARERAAYYRREGLSVETDIPL